MTDFKKDTRTAEEQAEERFDREASYIDFHNHYGYAACIREQVTPRDEFIAELVEALKLANDCAVLASMMHNALKYSGPDTDTFRTAEYAFETAKYAKPDMTAILTKARERGYDHE